VEQEIHPQQVQLKDKMVEQLFLMLLRLQGTQVLEVAVLEL
tara:strand:- start:211 stop:333 length:123 start_codon:yes stop_codon:yes gene_type:complete